MELLTDLGRHWGFKRAEDGYRVNGNVPFHEAGLLKLNCDKALLHLKWEPTLEYSETIRLVGEWYSTFHARRDDMYRVTIDQIDEYERLARERSRAWAIP